ncbi:hypothetical protein ASPCADRAFT_135687 [Aspergillus carbonarius ITEM 5010]|uniref:Uncharacterized protein n=1 Tax=Aspergillus carbonarius (strain ITEM 5010) TaxID=602072 RepID=A0A1R3R5P7_ASPC5|nr:hypothetical protein ASPCADRAFT_135687 [Aspergillus carbonarius ITEM 5010]
MLNKKAICACYSARLTSFFLYSSCQSGMDSPPHEANANSSLHPRCLSRPHHDDGLTNFGPPRGIRGSAANYTVAVVWILRGITGEEDASASGFGPSRRRLLSYSSVENSAGGGNSFNYFSEVHCLFLSTVNSFPGIRNNYQWSPTLRSEYSWQDQISFVSFSSRPLDSCYEFLYGEPVCSDIQSIVIDCSATLLY